MIKPTSPVLSLSLAFFYVFLTSIILYFTDFYRESSFFNWGPPVTFFGKNITDKKTFYLLLVLLFFHQIVNNSVNSVVYPWIINTIQNRKNRYLDYSTFSSLLIVNFFDLYSQIDVVFIVSGFVSQISFICVVIISNLITSTYINYQYIREKDSLTFYNIV